MDERRMIRKIQATGDRDAADALVRTYYDDVFRFMRRQVGSEDTARDLTQEVLISMLRTITYYDPAKASFRTWIMRIASNKLIDWLRSRSSGITEILSFDDIEPIGDLDISRGIEDAQLDERLARHLSEYPHQVQQIFRLHVFGEYTFVEIAEILQISDNTAKTQYYRLVRQLRKEYSDER